MEQTAHKSTAKDDSSEEDNPYTITEDMLRERLHKKSHGKMKTQILAAIIGKCL